MEPTLEAIKGGGGSIKVGTTGTISALMSKELEPTKSASRMKLKTPPDEPSSSRGTTKRTKIHTRSTHQIPMLTADDNISIDGTPIRKTKPVKKGPAGVVEIVDIKCGSPDRKWIPVIKSGKGISPVAFRYFYRRTNSCIIGWYYNESRKWNQVPNQTWLSL